MAGYSGTPLAAKLGIGAGMTVALLAEPDGVIGPLPDGVQVRRRAQGHPDVVVAFFVARARFEARLDALGALVFPDAGLWIAWPKRASGVATDMTAEAVRDAALPLGLVDNKVCAIDDTWTGLRVVWRVDRRST